MSKQIIPRQVPLRMRHRAAFCAKYCDPDEQIKKCYYRNALRLHPDRETGAPDAWYTMKEIYDDVEPEKQGLTCSGYKNALFDEYNKTLTVVLAHSADLPAEFTELLEKMNGDEEIFNLVKDVEPAPRAEVQAVLGDMPPQSKSMKWTIFKWIGIALTIFALIVAATHYSSTNTVPLNQRSLNPLEAYTQLSGCTFEDKTCFKNYVRRNHPDKTKTPQLNQVYLKVINTYGQAKKYNKKNEQARQREQLKNYLRARW